MDSIISFLNQGSPWIWYFSRATGILAYIFLWFAIFLGLAIRNPKLKKMVAPIYSLSYHSFLAAIATFWALVHGTSLLLDKAFPFSPMDIFVPFYSQTTFLDPTFLALGIMAFYLMVILTLTSYFRKYMNQKFWKAIHLVSPLAFIFVVLHGLQVGTDLKNVYLSAVYLTASGSLIVVYLSNLYYRFKKTS